MKTQIETIREITNDYLSLANMKTERSIKKVAFLHGLVKPGSMRERLWTADIERLNDCIDTLEWSLSIIEESGGVWSDSGEFVKI